MEYKIRRLVNDYLQPPKTALRLEQGLEHFARCGRELEEMGASEPHDLMRAAECEFILDCAEMAAPRLALPHGEPVGPLSLPTGLSGDG